MSLWTARGLAVVRIAFGLYFLLSAWKKTSANWFGDAGPIVNFLQTNLPQSAGFYRPFLEGAVLPNADTFAGLVALGEWLAGISLLLGLFTRLGGLTATLLTLNFILAKGFGSLVGGPIVSTDWLFVLVGLACLVGSAGLVWGLDGLGRRTFAAHPLTRWLTGARPDRAVTLPLAGPTSRVVQLRPNRGRRAS